MKQVYWKNKGNWFFLLFCGGIACVTLFFCSKNSFLYPFNNWVDENAFFTVGKAWGHGMIPYRDLFEQKGPLLYLVFMLASFITPTSFFTIFVIELFSYTVFLYYSGKIISLFLSRRFCYYILPMFASLITGSAFFSQGGSAEEFCLPMLMITLYHFLRYFCKDEDLSYGQIFKVGFLAGCMAMIKFTFLGFPFAFIMCIFLSLLGRGQYKRAIYYCFIFLGGMGIPIIAFALYFLYHHCFFEFIHTYLFFNIFHYTDQIPFLLRLEKAGIAFYRKLSHNIFTFHLIDVGCLYFLCSNWLKSRESKIAFGLFFGLGALGVYFGAKDFLYYFLIIMPFSLFGFISFFGLLNKKKKMLEDHKFLHFVQGIIVVLSIGFLACSPNLSYAKNKKEDLVQYQFAQLIKEAGGKTLLNYQFLDGGFYFASDILPNTRYFEKQNAVVPGMEEELRYMIEQKEFDFIVLRKTAKSRAIDEVVLKNYDLVQMESEKNGLKDYYYFLYQKKNENRNIVC